MKKEAIALLKEKILQKTGINLEQYRNQDLVESIADLLLFPKYVLKIMLTTMLGFFAAWVVLLLWANFQEKIMLGFFGFWIGLVLVILNTLVFGMLRLMKSLEHDLNEILQLTVGAVQQVFKDFKNVKLQLKAHVFELPSVSEMLQGVLFAVMLPTLRGVIKKKVPVLGTPLAFLAEQVFTILGNQLASVVSKNENDLKEKIGAKAEILENEAKNTVEGFADRGIQILEKVRKTTEKIVSPSMKIITFPIRMAAWLVGVLSSLIMFVILLLFA